MVSADTVGVRQVEACKVNFSELACQIFDSRFGDGGWNQMANLESDLPGVHPNKATISIDDSSSKLQLKNIDVWIAASQSNQTTVRFESPGQ
jgi:hypothetical protein